jgi:hypothetical protein
MGFAVYYIPCRIRVYQGGTVHNFKLYTYIHTHQRQPTISSPVSKSEVLFMKCNMRDVSSTRGMACILLLHVIAKSHDTIIGIAYEHLGPPSEILPVFHADSGILVSFGRLRCKLKASSRCQECM